MGSDVRDLFKRNTQVSRQFLQRCDIFFWKASEHRSKGSSESRQEVTHRGDAQRTVLVEHREHVRVPAYLRDEEDDQEADDGAGDLQ